MMCLSEVGSEPSMTGGKQEAILLCVLLHCHMKKNQLDNVKTDYQSQGLTITHRGEYHRRRQDPGWLSLRNSALTLAELPSEGCTAYLEIRSISLQFLIGTEHSENDISQ